MRTPKTLNVYANPWHGGLDHNERPCCAVPAPHDGVSEFYDRRWIGASPKIDTDGELYFEFAQYGADWDLLPKAEPVIVANDVHQGPRYRQAIAAGELLAADVATYRSVFGTERGYLPAAEIAAAEKAASLKAHEFHGRGPADPKPCVEKLDPIHVAAEQAVADAAALTVASTKPVAKVAPAPVVTTIAADSASGAKQ